VLHVMFNVYFGKQKFSQSIVLYIITDNFVLALLFFVGEITWWLEIHLMARNSKSVYEARTLLRLGVSRCWRRLDDRHRYIWLHLIVISQIIISVCVVSSVCASLKSTLCCGVCVVLVLVIN
jgi:dolichol kinase